MKKKNLKSLKLNKKSISNFRSTNVNGGSGTCLPIIKYFVSEVLDCASDNCSVQDGDGCMSQNGCTGGPDETMTCANYSCAC